MPRLLYPRLSYPPKPLRRLSVFVTAEPMVEGVFVG